MLTSSQAPKYAYLRKVAVYPLVAISLILVSFRLSSQKPKHHWKQSAYSTAATEQKQATLDQKLAAIEQRQASLDQKKLDEIDERQFALDQKQLAAIDKRQAAKDKNQLHVIDQNKLTSRYEVKTINADTSSMIIKGTRDGKEITVTVKGSNKNIAPKDQARVVLKPLSGDKIKPLIVIDGVLTSEINLNDLNPTNIKSMNVLKGENASSKYGDKGANGVIEITTKKP